MVENAATENDFLGIEYPLENMNKHAAVMLILVISILSSFAGAESLPVPVDQRGLSKEMTNFTIAKYRTEVRDCYDKVLKTDPKREGRIVIKFLIETNGSVKDAIINKDTIHSPSLNTCLLKSVNSWKFPKSLVVTHVENYPFYFRPVNSNAND